MYSNSMNPKYKTLLDKYIGSFSNEVTQYASKKVLLSLPDIEPNVIESLFKDARKIFEEEPILLEARSPCIVVGDIHGQILDLYRILTTFGMPNRQRYVFLGDFVDRGEFSIEVIVIVFILKVLWPDNVFIIRGNHEFQFLCSQCGFMSQMIDFFGDNYLFNICEETFEYIPLAARIDGKMLCVHGGIGPSLSNLSQIGNLRRPIDDYDGDLLDSLVWSDPSEAVETFEPSTRGTGFFFGEKALTDFLKASKIEMIIRGHECVNDGVEFHFNEKCCTVFSASNYCGLVGNQAGVLEITAPMTYKVRQFAPLDWLLRGNVRFVSITSTALPISSKLDNNSPHPRNNSKNKAAQSIKGLNNMHLNMTNVNDANNDYNAQRSAQGQTCRSGVLVKKLKVSSSAKAIPKVSSSIPSSSPPMSVLNAGRTVANNGGNAGGKLAKYSQSVKVLPKLEFPAIDENEEQQKHKVKKPIMPPPNTSARRNIRRKSFD